MSRRKRRNQSSSPLAAIAAGIAGLVAGNQMKQQAIEQAHLDQEWERYRQIEEAKQERHRQVEEAKRKRRLLAITNLQPV